MSMDGSLALALWGVGAALGVVSLCLKGRSLTLGIMSLVVNLVLLLAALALLRMLRVGAQPSILLGNLLAAMPGFVARAATAEMMSGSDCAKHLQAKRVGNEGGEADHIAGL
jgi:hypothetical protein